jgi:predicted RNase H-like HicB family nuclease
MKLKILIEDGGNGWLVGTVPALPGCISQGKNREELIANAKEAIEGWLEVEQDKIESTNPQEVELVTV